MPRSPLTEIIQKVSALAEQIHALPEDERNYLLDLLLPEPEPEPQAKPKKSRKRGSKSASKSPRAASLETALKGRVGAAKPSGDDGIVLCAATLQAGVRCALPEGHRLHEDKTYIDYHPFQPSTTAPPATPPSPANGADGSTTANSVVETASAGVAVGGSSNE